MIDSENIRYSIDSGIGWILLDRPKAYNALTTNMIQKIYSLLKEWENHANVHLICIEGSGEKAFCAGGDVSALYHQRNQNSHDFAFRYFGFEYRLNLLLHQYSKPVIAYLDGYVLGGGVGISIGASHRIVTENSKWAMPEMRIGFYPDVGSSHFLSRMKRNIGIYLALTARSISSEDILECGAADVLIASEQWPSLKKDLKETDWKALSVHSELDRLIGSYHTDPQKVSALRNHQDEISHHFSFDTMESVLASLEHSDTAWAEKTLQDILKGSPTSHKVTLKQLLTGKNKNLLSCFEMELTLSMNFMQCDDFFEGVRATLIDKDHAPNWSPRTHLELTPEYIESFFSYPWKSSENPLLTIDPLHSDLSLTSFVDSGNSSSF